VDFCDFFGTRKIFYPVLLREETEALLEWERELKRVEERRLGELEDIIAGGESDQSKSFALSSNAFDNQSQFQELPQLAHRECEHFFEIYSSIQECLVC
jgi:hypothetical protein